MPARILHGDKAVHRAVPLKGLGHHAVHALRRQRTAGRRAGGKARLHGRDEDSLLRPGQRPVERKRKRLPRRSALAAADKGRAKLRVLRVRRQDADAVGIVVCAQLLQQAAHAPGIPGPVRIRPKKAPDRLLLLRIAVHPIAHSPPLTHSDQAPAVGHGAPVRQKHRRHKPDHRSIILCIACFCPAYNLMGKFAQKCRSALNMRRQRGHGRVRFEFPSMKMRRNAVQ